MEADTPQRPPRRDEAERAGLLGGKAEDDALGWALDLDGPPDDQQPKQHTPLWAWGLLVAAVLAVSSAGLVFSLMKEVPAVQLAGWRLQVTSVYLLAGGAYQFARLPPDRQRRTLQTGWLLLVSGTSLALHFGSWVWSVEQTSLVHSLLYVSATPLILAGGAWLLRRPISRGELAGTAVGVAGAVVLATAGARGDREATFAGDMAALAASAAIVVYLLIGRSLRAWQPLCVYAGAVTLVAAAELTLLAVPLDGARPLRGGLAGSFGWLTSRRYAPKLLYLGTVPGLVGHTGINFLLKYMDPLIITLALNFEPLVGSLMGWAAGVSAPPGRWTYLGGALLMASTAWVTLASTQREREQEERERARQTIERIFSSDEGAAGGGGGEGLRAPPDERR